jgi:hypothetical protein
MVNTSTASSKTRMVSLVERARTRSSRMAEKIVIDNRLDKAKAEAKSARAIADEASIVGHEMAIEKSTKTCRKTLRKF